MTHYPGGFRQPPTRHLPLNLNLHWVWAPSHPRAGPTRMGLCARDAGPPRRQNRLHHVTSRTIVRAMTPLSGKVGPVDGQLCCKGIPDNCLHVRQSSATAASVSWVKLHAGTPRRHSPLSRLPLWAATCLSRRCLLSGVIIWYSGLVWMHTMHEWPLAIHWR
jgi:hypothetical protein